MESTSKGLGLFLDVRMRRIFLLGMISGFPWVLIGSALSLWLKEDGLSRSAVGWAGLIFAVYSVNFMGAAYRPSSRSFFDRQARSSQSLDINNAVDYSGRLAVMGNHCLRII